MIDCHSHILPHFDDGAKNTDTALKMLSESFSQGVEAVISTSHCYPKCAKDILRFTAARNEAFEGLKQRMAESGGEYPEIYPASELNMLTDVSEYEEIKDICIGDTNYILIEMPMTAWKEWMIEAVYKLTAKGYRPIMAHIDRYLAQDKRLLESLHELGAAYQLNAEAIIDSKMRKYAFKLIENGCVQLLGSDMHNLSDRAPNMKRAADITVKYMGEECMRYFNDNARAVLEGRDVSVRKFKQKSFFERLRKK